MEMLSMEKEAVPGIAEAEALKAAVIPEGEQQSCSHQALDSTTPGSIERTVQYVGVIKTLRGQSLSHSLPEPPRNTHINTTGFIKRIPLFTIGMSPLPSVTTRRMPMYQTQDVQRVLSCQQRHNDKVLQRRMRTTIAFNTHHMTDIV